MSLHEIGQNSNPNNNQVILSTSTNTNDNKNMPTETDLLNEPESAIEITYNVETEKLEKISQINQRQYDENNSEYNQENKPFLFYGNNYHNLHPKHLGKTIALFYYKDNPLIIIGPDCKLILIILYNNRLL